MKSLRKRAKTSVVIGALIFTALLFAIFALNKQRFPFPSWLPAVGESTAKYSVILDSAQAVSPGQGQAVTMAGVDVGDIAEVTAKDGRGKVTFNVEQRYEHLMKQDATVSLRPKTALYDMVLEIDPGRSDVQLKEGSTIALANSTSPVNMDQILSSLDSDTRQAFQILVNGADKGLAGQSKALSQSLGQIPPVTRNIRAISKALAGREDDITRAISSLAKVTDSLAANRGNITKAVSASRKALAVSAVRKNELQQAINTLPGTLTAASSAFTSGDRLARELSASAPTIKSNLAVLRQTLSTAEPFLKSSSQTTRNDLIPFFTDTKSIVTKLGTTSNNTSMASQPLGRSLNRLNDFNNTLAYNPDGEEQGYLFWAQWFNHNFAWLFNTHDAHGTARRVALVFSCQSLLRTVKIVNDNQPLALIARLVEPLEKAGFCPTGQQGEAQNLSKAKQRSVGESLDEKFSQLTGSPTIPGSVQAEGKELSR